MSTTYSVDLLFKAPNTDALTRMQRQIESLERALEKTGRGTEETFSGTEKGARKATTAVQGLVGALGPLLAAYASFRTIQSIFTAGAEIETQTRSIKVLTGSLASARDIIKQLQDYGAVTPFTSSELIDTAKRLKAFGVDTAKIVDVTKRLGDVAGATGADLNGIATAYGQVMAKGRLQSEELLQFQERGIAVGEELRKMYGDQFPKALERGLIPAKAVEVALARMTSQGGQYFGGAIAQADTLTGKLSTLQDSFQRLAQNIGTALAPVFKWVIDSLNTILEKINDMLFNGGKLQQREFQAQEQANREMQQKYGRFATIPGRASRDEALAFAERRRKEILAQKRAELGGPPKAAASAPPDLTTPALLTGGAGDTAGKRLADLQRDTIQRLSELEKDADKEAADLRRDYLKEYNDARKDAIKEIGRMEKELVKEQLDANRKLEDARADLALQRDIGGLSGTADEQAVQKKYMEAFAGFRQRERDRQRTFEDKQRELATKLEDFKVRTAETIGRINLRFQETWGKNQLRYAETAGKIVETAARNAGEIQLEYATRAAQVTQNAAAGGGGGATGGSGGLAAAIDRIGGAYQFRGTTLAANKRPGDYQSDPRENFFFDKRPNLIAGAKARIATLTPADKAALAFTVLTEAGPTDIGKMDVAANLLVRSANLGNAPIGAVAKMPGQYEGVFRYTRPQIEDPAFGRKVFGAKYDRTVSMLSGGGGFGSASVAGSGFGQDVINKAIVATTRFAGVTNECASTVKAFMGVVGINADVMDRSAKSAEKMGMVMTDWSKLKPGDIVARGRVGDPEHVGVYTGGQNVFHQSGSRGLRTGNYADLNYFKEQGYFIRPGGTGGTGGTAPAIPDYKAKISPYPTMPALLGVPDLTKELAPFEAKMAALLGTSKELRDTLTEADLAKIFNDLSAPINDITADMDRQIKQGKDLAEQDKLRLEYMRDGYAPAMAEQLSLIDAQSAAMQEKLNYEIASLETELAKLDVTDKLYETTLKLLNLAKERRDEIPGKVAQLRNQAVAADAAKKNPQNILTQGIAERQEQLDALLNPANQLITAADAIGGAFGQAFQDIASGSMTAGEAMSAMFKRIGAAFLDMAAQMLAQQAALGILKLFGGSLLGGGGGGGNGFLTGGLFDSGLGAGFGVTGFAKGGFVNGPTAAVIGEGGESEYVIPSSKMGTAMTRYSMGARGKAVLAGGGPAPAGGGHPGSGGASVRYEVTRINDVRYVTEEQFVEGMEDTRRRATRDGAAGGYARVHQSMVNKRSVRSRWGIK